jgi:hypothetical protein
MLDIKPLIPFVMLKNLIIHISFIGAMKEHSHATEINSWQLGHFFFKTRSDSFPLTTKAT